MVLEAEVNRWAVLFYAHQALRAFRAGNSQDFRELRDVLTAVLARPVALEEPIWIRLRIIQILSRLEEESKGSVGTNTSGAKKKWSVEESGWIKEGVHGEVWGGELENYFSKLPF